MGDIIMKNKIFAMFISFVFLVVVNIVLLSNCYKTNDLVFVTDTFNYSSKFAKNNGICIKYEDIDNLILYDFDYVVDSSNVIITGYKGISEEVVIPSFIDGIPVIKVEKNTFLNSKVKRVYIGSNIISYDDNSKVDLYCYDNSNCNYFSGNYNVIIQEDSDIDYSYREVLFEYSVYGNEIELKKYLGTDDDIVIPYQINGYKVVSISFSLEGKKNVTIPSSIKIINNNVKYDKGLFISCLFNVLAYIIFVVLTLLFVKDNDKKNDFYLISTIYLVLQFILSCELYSKVVKIVCYSIFLMIFYVLLFILLIKRRKKKVVVLSKSTFIEDSLYEIRKYKNKNYKKIEGLIVSSGTNESCINSLDIEKDIINKIQGLKKNNSKEDIYKIKELIKKRNNICKKNKRTK